MGRRRRKNRAKVVKGTPGIKTTYGPQPLIVPHSPWIGRLNAGGKRLVALIVAAIGLLGVYVLRPDVSIEPYATLDATRPFQQQFYVQNNSVYPIHDVEPMCGFNADSNFGMRDFSIIKGNERVETLEAGAKTNLTCDIGTGPVTKELNIVPWVKYKVPGGITRCKAAKFKGKAAVGGAYVWTYNGSDQC